MKQNLKRPNDNANVPFQDQNGLFKIENESQNLEK